MKKQLKNKEELFDYLMYGYSYELEEVQTRAGVQRRLKDSKLEEELKNKTKENIKVKDLQVELKLGPNYNRNVNPWIQIYTKANKSGTKGRYVGISFSKEKNEIDLWIGFGRTGKKQSEIYDLTKEYNVRYSLIEPNLKYNFEYNIDYTAICVIKKINIKTFKEAEFERDLEYITDLYKAYEKRFENENVPISVDEYLEFGSERKITYEEINKRMLALIEEVGNLAKAIKELGEE